MCIPYAFILFIGKHLCNHKQLSFGDRQQSINIYQLFLNSSLIFLDFKVPEQVRSLTCWSWREVFQRRAPGPCCWGLSEVDRTADRTLLLSVPCPGNFPTLPACTEKNTYFTLYTQLMEHFWPRRDETQIHWLCLTPYCGKKLQKQTHFSIFLSHGTSIPYFCLLSWKLCFPFTQNIAARLAHQDRPV